MLERIEIDQYYRETVHAPVAIALRAAATETDQTKLAKSVKTDISTMTAKKERFAPHKE